MNRRRLAATALVLSTASLLALPTAASGHTDNLYTWAFVDPESESFSSGFATTSKSDAALAFLGDQTNPTIGGVSGMEICADSGYAVGYAGEPSIVQWNHDSGAVVGEPVGLSLATDPDSELFVYELDSLADCTLLTILQYPGEFEAPDTAVAVVDPVSGVVTTKVLLDPLGDGAYRGIATDPVSGVTYLFGDDGETTGYWVVNVAAGTYSDFVPTPAVPEYFSSDTFAQGADFDAAGGLWIVMGVIQQENYRLVSFAPGADLATAEPISSPGILPSGFQSGVTVVGTPIPLAADHTVAVKPALAATGSTTQPLIAAALLALVGLGFALVVASKRRIAK